MRCAGGDFRQFLGRRADGCGAVLPEEDGRQVGKGGAAVVKCVGAQVRWRVVEGFLSDVIHADQLCGGLITGGNEHHVVLDYLGIDGRSRDIYPDRIDAGRELGDGAVAVETVVVGRGCVRVGCADERRQVAHHLIPQGVEDGDV